MATSNSVATIRTMKRLSEAAGYLELGMTKQALGALDHIEQPGSFAAAVEMLRGHAARLEHRFDDAASLFENVARMLPGANSKPLWLAISMFHRQAGNTHEAIETLAHARGALPPKTKPKKE